MKRMLNFITRSWSAASSSSSPLLLFFTMDGSRDAVIGRMIAKLTGFPINDVQRKAQNQGDEQLVGDAYGWMQDMASAGRLDIQEMSEVTTMSLISQTLRVHANRGKLILTPPPPDDPRVILLLGQAKEGTRYGQEEVYPGTDRLDAA